MSAPDVSVADGATIDERLKRVAAELAVTVADPQTLLAVDKVAELQALKLIKEITDSLRPPRVKTLQLAILFGTIATVVSVLSVDLPSAHVAADLKSAGVRLTAGPPGVPSQTWWAREVSVNDIEMVVAPSAKGTRPQRIQTGMLHLKAVDGQKALAIVVPDLEPAASISLRRAGRKGSYIVELCGVPDELAISFPEGAAVETDQGPIVGLAPSGRILVQAGSVPDGGRGMQADCTRPHVTLTIAVDQELGRDLLRDAPISELSLSEFAILESGTTTRLAALPAVEGGTIVFTGVKDKTVQVPRRSHLVLGQAHGLLRQVSSDDDGSLHVSFDGEVSSLRAGATEAATSLVPSILEWVLARNSLFLIWSTSVSVFGLFVAALKRLTRVTA